MTIKLGRFFELMNVIFAMVIVAMSAYFLLHPWTLILTAPPLLFLTALVLKSIFKAKRVEW